MAKLGETQQNLVDVESGREERAERNRKSILTLIAEAETTQAEVDKHKLRAEAEAAEAER